MLQFLVGKDELHAPGGPKATWEGNHTDEFFQHHVGCVDKCLLTNFTTGDFGLRFTASAEDMAFATLYQIGSTVLLTKATGQEAGHLFILKEAVHVDGYTVETSITDLWPFKDRRVF